MRQPEGREVVIVEAVRTPIGRGHREKGYYKDTHPNKLLAKCYTEVIERSGVDASEVEDVIAGCVQQFGEQGFNIARNAWLQAGLPIETPGTTVDRQCGSAQQAVNFSAALIAAGVHDAMIGSGVEHMGHLPVRRRHEDAGGLRLRLHARADGQAQHRRPGSRRRDDRRPVGDLPLRARRARRALAPARPPGDRGGPLRAGDRADGRRRADARHRPGHPPRNEPRGALAAEAGVQAGRQDHRGQRLADLRRRRGRAADVRREGEGARPDAARADRRPDDRRLRPGENARGPDPRHAQDPRAQLRCRSTTST